MKNRQILILIITLFITTLITLLFFTRPAPVKIPDMVLELIFVFQPAIWVYLAKKLFKKKSLLPSLYIGCALFLLGGIFEILEEAFWNNAFIDYAEDILLLIGALFLTHAVYKMALTSRRQIFILSKKNREHYINSIQDSLTKLYNKRYLQTNFKEIFNNNPAIFTSSVCVFADIDNFKVFNDTLGHESGDKLLAKLGEIISDSKRKGDFGFRYGGEEFLMFYMNTKPEYIYEKLEHIRVTFKEHTAKNFPSDKVNFTLSIGVTEYKYGEELSTTIERADSSMYDAKHSGKDRICIN